jgi:hypothetical protein
MRAAVQTHTWHLYVYRHGGQRHGRQSYEMTGAERAQAEGDGGGSAAGK